MVRVVGAPRPVLWRDPPLPAFVRRSAAGVRRGRIPEQVPTDGTDRSFRLVRLEREGHVHVETVLPQLPDALPERVVAPRRNVAVPAGLPGHRAVHAVVVVEPDRDQNPVGVHPTEPGKVILRDERAGSARILPGLDDSPVRSPIARNGDRAQRELKDVHARAGLGGGFRRRFRGRRQAGWSGQRACCPPPHRSRRQTAGRRARRGSRFQAGVGLPHHRFRRLSADPVVPLPGSIAGDGAQVRPAWAADTAVGVAIESIGVTDLWRFLWTGL